MEIVVYCWNNRINVIDNTIKNNFLIKTNNFNLFNYNPLILGMDSGNTYKIVMNNLKLLEELKKYLTAYEEKFLREINQDKYLPVFLRLLNLLIIYTQCIII